MHSCTWFVCAGDLPWGENHPGGSGPFLRDLGVWGHVLVDLASSDQRRSYDRPVPFHRNSAAFRQLRWIRNGRLADRDRVAARGLAGQADQETSQERQCQ